jgi:hypothetical protein
MQWSNDQIQATPGRAFILFLSQLPTAPDLRRTRFGETEMKSLSLILALVVITSLNAILLWGAGTAGNVVGSNSMFGILVLALDVSLVASSFLLGYLFWREHRVAWATLFFTNLLMMMVALVLKLTNTGLSSFVLFGADLYWLDLYLVCLCCEWRWFKIPPI